MDFAWHQSSSGSMLRKMQWTVARVNGCVNNREAGDLRRHRAHYDVTVMQSLLMAWML